MRAQTTLPCSPRAYAVTLALVGGDEAKMGSYGLQLGGIQPSGPNINPRINHSLPELMLDNYPLSPSAPYTLPNFGFDALQADIQQATHQLASRGNTQITAIEPVTKLFISQRSDSAGRSKGKQHCPLATAKW